MGELFVPLYFLQLITSPHLREWQFRDEAIAGLELLLDD